MSNSVVPPSYVWGCPCLYDVEYILDYLKNKIVGKVWIENLSLRCSYLETSINAIVKGGFCNSNLLAAKEYSDIKSLHYLL